MGPIRPVQVFSQRGEVMLEKAEMIQHLEAKQEALRSACEQGGELLACIFKGAVAPGLPRQFADSVYRALTVGLPEHIQFLKTLKDPEPLELQFGGVYAPTIEQLASAEMAVQDYEAQIEAIEHAQAEDLPPGVSVMMGVALPALKQQRQSAIDHREYLQRRYDEIAGKKNA